MGWDPLPLSVRDSRRLAAPLRDRLASTTPPARPAPLESTTDGDQSASVRKLTVTYGPVVALDGVDLTIMPGEVLALMGRNGSGKSTLLQTLSGMRRPTRGVVAVGGRDPQSFRSADLVRHVGLVPQDPGLLLYGESVQAECHTADKVSNLAPGTTQRVLERVLPRHAGRPPPPLATCPRVSVSPWPWPSSWPRCRSSSCSTSRPGDWTATRARTASYVSCVKAGRRRSCHCAGHPRCRAGGAGGRSRRGVGRRSDHRRRSRTPGGVPFADLRPAGGQGPRPRGMADSGRGP